MHKLCGHQDMYGVHTGDIIFNGSPAVWNIQITFWPRKTENTENKLSANKSVKEDCNSFVDWVTSDLWRNNRSRCGR